MNINAKITLIARALAFLTLSYILFKIADSFFWGTSNDTAFWVLVILSYIACSYGIDNIEKLLTKPSAENRKKHFFSSLTKGDLLLSIAFSLLSLAGLAIFIVKFVISTHTGFNTNILLYLVPTGTQQIFYLLLKKKYTK